MHEQLPQPSLPYSFLTSMYLSWQQHNIPAVYYHYLLSILPKKNKKQQILLMTKEIKSLKNNTHPYHNIVNAIQARERSLQVIKENIDVLREYQNNNDSKANTSQNPNNADLDFSGCYPTGTNSPYRVQHQDPRSPLLSPSLHPLNLNPKAKKQNELINHIRLYQRLTVQTILSISQWQKQLIDLCYSQSIINFQYHKQDYLSKLLYDTSQILDIYQHIFQNNCFLIIKKIHQKSQYALIYRELKVQAEFVQKIYQCLNILAQHQADVVKFRMIAKVNQSANRNRKITKSNSLMKKYMNYNNGGDYIVIKDTQTMKKSKVIVQPTLSRNKKQTDQQNQKLRKLKNSIIINPQARLMTIDRTQRKHPVQSPIFNLLRQTRRFPSNGRPQIKPAIPQVYFKSLNSQHDIPSPRKHSQPIIHNSTIKRSQSQDLPILKRNNSEIIITIDKSTGNKFKQTASQAKFRQPVQIKPVHWQHQIVVGQRDHNNRDDQLCRNKGLSMQRKLEVFDQVNSQRKLKNISYAEMKGNQKKNRDNQPAFVYNNNNNSKQIKLVQKQQKQSNKSQPFINQLPQQSTLKLSFEQNLKSSQILSYLRDKIFKQNSQIKFQQLQSIAKKILLQKNNITLIKIQCQGQSQGLMVAWMAVKFIQKDNITMGKSVYIVYVRKFVNVAHFQKKLAEIFVKYGYGLIRNQHKILYETYVIDPISKPILKIKYKISPSITQHPKQPLKSLIKTHKTLPQCRLLKYHTYSKQSKYHKYCNHSQTACSISYNFTHISKIYIDKFPYLQLKVDKIMKIDQQQQIYKISCVINDTDLIIARSLQSLIEIQRVYGSIQRDSSFQQQQEVNVKYIAIKEHKIMNKYVQNSNKQSRKVSNNGDELLLCQFVSVCGGHIPEVKSIAFTKQQLKDKVLIFDPPYYIAIASRSQNQFKTLAVVLVQ